MQRQGRKEGTRFHQLFSWCFMNDVEDESKYKEFLLSKKWEEDVTKYYQVFHYYLDIKKKFFGVENTARLKSKEYGIEEKKSLDVKYVISKDGFVKEKRVESQIYGMKGIIDLELQTEIKHKEKTDSIDLVLELKTSKYLLESQIQTMLYT